MYLFLFMMTPDSEINFMGNLFNLFVSSVKETCNKVLQGSKKDFFGSVTLISEKHFWKDASGF